LKKGSSKYLYIFAFWLFAVALSFVWNLRDYELTIQNVLIGHARGLFRMIEVHRNWNTEHGGVYVPITGKTRPNPYLQGPDRDVRTEKGIALTKINPAYMTRQVGELTEQRGNVHFNITSLNPIRPENKADKWESAALRAIEGGANEVFELVKKKGADSHFRYMAPLFTGPSCLKCHEEQGYKEGDIRGGISVSFDEKEALSAYGGYLFHMFFIHIGALLAGGVFILWLTRYSRKADRKLEDERNRFQDLVELTSAVHWEVDIATLTFTYISPQVEGLLGYPAEDWKDFNYWVSRLHPEDREWAPAYCNEHTAKSEDHIFTYRSIAADGRVVWIRDIVSVVIDEKGNPVRLRGLFLDDTVLKTAEEKLRLSVKEKEVLMREIHHRVKNNMAVITSLQNLQANRLEDGSAKEALTESMNRIKSMSLVHEMIYERGDLASMEVGDYLERMLAYISGSLSFPRDRVRLDVDIKHECQDLDMLIPMGLILNELVTNAVKHAFDDTSDGAIDVSLKCDDSGRIVLEVRDNGKGLPEDLSLERAESLGLLLVKSLVGQLDGTAEIKRDGGTAFVITFFSKQDA